MAGRALVCTILVCSAAGRIITGYVAWSVEKFGFAESKQLLDFTNPQCGVQQFGTSGAEMAWFVGTA